MLLSDRDNSERKIIAQPLREQIYEYLRDEINRGNLLPGSLVNTNEISREMGISKTPLRDALIQLECDGFVTILPRRGVVVKKLTLKDVKSSWEICRACECEMIIPVFNKIDDSCLKEMDRINAEMKEASERADADRYYLLNVAFHDVFLSLSENRELRRIITLNKNRLYDFLTRTHVKEWEIANCIEHTMFIDLIRQGDPNEASWFLRNIHWAFEKQEPYIRRFYFDGSDAEHEGV